MLKITNLVNASIKNNFKTMGDDQLDPIVDDVEEELDEEGMPKKIPIDGDDAEEEDVDAM